MTKFQKIFDKKIMRIDKKTFLVSKKVQFSFGQPPKNEKAMDTPMDYNYQYT